MTSSHFEELVEGALGLAARGFPVLSLRARSKIPVHTGWPNLSMLNPDAIRLEWQLNPDSNVGVLCGPDALDGDGLIIVDIDLPDGPITLEELESEHGKLPPTITVATPSGGSHRYYRGHAVSWNPGPGLEVRSAGRQCVAPPSVHPNGGRYAWAGEGVNFIARAPAWLSAPQKAARSRREATRSDATRSSHSNGMRDPVLDVAPAVYFKELCGLVPDEHGFVSCPVHPFPDAEPSCKVYATALRGWFCYGEECRQGGDVVTLAALLADIPLPLVGYQFICALDYLRGRLLP